MLALLAALTIASVKPFNFYGFGPYQNNIPRPEQILHYQPGTHHTNFRDQESVYRAIAAEAKQNVREIQYGTTPEGRPLRIFVVGSSQNISNLAQIQHDHERLARGEGDAKNVVPIVWINECIHGDETASFESGMWTFYNLVASRNPKITDALRNSIVVINPVYNPDGHERYVVYYNSIATGSPESNAFENREPSIIYGRLNHYRIDMNRDRIAFSQFETQEEFAEMLKWNPQVYIDQHGQVGSYFFPPEPMSVNVNVDRARNAKWTDYFGRATGAAFDSRGMSYYVKDEFDLYYPGYIDSSNTLSGAIGMTQETDGGRVLATRRTDGSILTLAQGMAKHFTSALAVFQAAAQKHQELMDDYATFKKRAVDGTAAGEFKRVVVTSTDPRPLDRLQAHLAHAGITSYFAAPFSQANAHNYWTGKVENQKFDQHALVVDMAQSQSAFAKALLDPRSFFEPEFIKAQTGKKAAVPDGEKYPGPEGAEFYDMTGWALPYAYDLKAWWCESAPPLAKATREAKVDVHLAPSTIGYALRYTDQQDILAVFDALGKGVRGMVTNKPMKLGTKSYPRGTFLFLAGRNEDEYEKVLKATAEKYLVRFEPLESSYPEEGRDGPGSDSMSVLKKPSIAIVMGSGDRLSECGALWFQMENAFKLPFTFISEEALGQDLSSFTAVVLPQGSNLSRSDKFREWLSNGNVAVVLGNVKSASAFQELPEVKGELQDMPGSLFLANMDFRSFLTYGYEKPDIAVPISGDHFYTHRKEGGSIITLSNDAKAKKLLTGWEWPDETEKSLTDALFLQDMPVGRGHVVVYTQDPTERDMWPGLNKTLLNAILLGSAQ